MGRTLDGSLEAEPMKKTRLFLLTALATMFLLAIPIGPVFAEETKPLPADGTVTVSSDGTDSTDPAAPDSATGEGSTDPGVSEGSEGSGELPPETPGDPVDLPVDVTPMEKTVDGDGILTTTGSDEPGAVDDVAAQNDDPELVYRTLGVNAAAGGSLTWIWIGLAALAGLVVGFGAGFLVRRPAKTAAPQA